MLKLKPNCEYCDKDLPADAADAFICSYECTFCKHCIDTVLHNVCPNCGGGFTPRPIRPAKAHRDGVGLPHQPASTERIRSKFTTAEIEDFVLQLKDIPTADR